MCHGNTFTVFIPETIGENLLQTKESHAAARDLSQQVQGFIFPIVNYMLKHYLKFTNATEFTLHNKCDWS